MKQVHKRNLLIIWVCVISLSITTVLTYGSADVRTLKGCLVLIPTGIIVSLIWKLCKNDFVTALSIVLIPSYAVMLYSIVVGGNEVAFMATFVTLGMAVRYFDKRIIKYYTIPFLIVFTIQVVICALTVPDYFYTAEISKGCIFAVSSYLMYIGTEYGERKIAQASEALRVVEQNKNHAISIATKLNADISNCNEQVHQVNMQAEAVKESATQMEQVMDDASKSVIRVSERLNVSKEQIDRNYEYANQLEQGFEEMNQAVSTGNMEAKEVQNSMNTMAITVEEAKDVTITLLDKMETITEILNNINTIASQTNLLSLNASIEAARAGENGRGFAVVADQIRSLSEDSRRSAEGIQKILFDIAETTANVTDKITMSANEAHASAAQINKLITVLNRIDESALSASELVKQEYLIIENVKNEFDDIHAELETVAATSEENTSMISGISDNIGNQTGAIHELSNSVGNLKETSESLETYFS